MVRQILLDAIDVLKEQYSSLNWSYNDSFTGDPNEKLHCWPGKPEEEVLISVHRSNGQQELFHRHDYFYFNFTYEGQYDSLSRRYGERITVREGELYAGQPLAGHAIGAYDNDKTTIISVLVQKGSFFHSCLPMLTANSDMFHFLLDPQANRFSDEFLHFKIDDDCNTRALLQMMVVDYAFPQDDTVQMLNTLTVCFLMQLTRQYLYDNQMKEKDSLAARIVQYIGSRSDTVTLTEVAEHFSYNPNYVSTILTRETGHSFSQILLEQRMRRAVALLRGTDLPVSDIALMLGYNSNSNFYKAFRGYYHLSPRAYLEEYPALV